MSVNSVQGAGQKSNVLGGVVSSLKDTAVVATTGLAIGGFGGKLATLASYKPSQAALDLQYGDIFSKAIGGKGVSKILKDAGDDVISLINKGKGVKSIASQKAETDLILKSLSGVSEKEFASDEVQDAVKSLFKKNKKIQEGGFSKEEILSKLKVRSDKFRKALKDKFGVTSLDEVKASFIEKVKGLKNKQIDDIAEKGAKHLRNKSIIGAGMAIGLIGMLVLNVLKTSGIIKPKAKSAQPNASQSIVSPKISSHQG